MVVQSTVPVLVVTVTEFPAPAVPESVGVWLLSAWLAVGAVMVGVGGGEVVTVHGQVAGALSLPALSMATTPNTWLP